MSPSTTTSNSAPKMEPQWLDFAFLATAHHPPHVPPMHHPAPIATSFTPPHHLPASPSTATSNGTPSIEPQRLNFGFLAPHSLAHGSPMHQPTTITTSYKPPCHLPASPSTAISSGAPETEQGPVAQFRTFGTHQSFFSHFPLYFSFLVIATMCAMPHISVLAIQYFGLCSIFLFSNNIVFDAIFECSQIT